MLTLKQVNEKVNQCKGKNWLKEVKVEFEYPHLDLSIQKEGFHDIYQYVARQKRGWDKITLELPRELRRGKNLFNELIVDLEQFIDDGINSDEITLKSLWARSINSKIKSIPQNKMFPIDSPVTTFLVDTYKKGTDFYNGAYEYLIVKDNMSFNSANKLSGALMAYEYEFQEATTLPKRRGQEKSSNSQLRNSFEKFFTETQKNVNEFYSTNQKFTDDFSKAIDSLFIEKESLFDKWFNAAKDKEEEYNKHSLNRVKELEVLYSDKLMLEKPADYWKNRATELKKEANSWLRWLIISSSVSVVILIVVLAFISNGTLADLFSKTGSAIRWSIVFITLISFLAYVIRTFTKLSFSAYHLVRDAEERKQLVYVYLALKQDKAIKDEERILILQSIFSRADSGLLKEDSSPTMPGSNNVMDKLFRNN